MGVSSTRLTAPEPQERKKDCNDPPVDSLMVLCPGTYGFLPVLPLKKITQQEVSICRRLQSHCM